MRRLSVALLMLAAFPSVAAAETQSLSDALASAYMNNPSLLAERARLRATDEGVAQASSGWRPSIDAIAGVGHSRQEAVGYGSDRLNPHDVGVRVTQPIFKGFRTTASTKAAEAQVLAGRARLESAEQQILFDTARAYLDVVQNQQVLELTRLNENVLHKQLEATRSRFDIGEATKTDVSQSTSRLSAATAARIQAEGNLANTHATFTRLVGAPPGKLRQPVLKWSPPSSLDELISLAENKNPAVIESSHAQAAADAQVTFAKGNLLPEVNLVGTASRAWEQSVLIPRRQDEATIMARVTIPLYRAGTDYSKTREAHETATQRRLELTNARNLVHEQTVRAWQSMLTSRAAIEAHRSEVTAAELALYGVREEQKAGTRTTLDVLNAEQEHLNARVNLVKARHDAAIALLQIRAAIGDLTADAMGLKVDRYNPVEHYDEVRGKWLGLGG